MATNCRIWFSKKDNDLNFKLTLILTSHHTCSSGFSLIANRFYWVLLPIFFVLFTAEPLRATPTLDITGLSEDYLLTEYLEVLEDPSGKLTYDQVSTIHKHRFQSLEELPNIYDHKNQVVWLKIKVRNRSNNEHFLLSLGLIDEAEVYNAGTMHIKRNGMLVPFDEREHYFGRYPYIDLMLYRGESSNIYIKVYQLEEVSLQNDGGTRPLHKMRIFYYQKVEDIYNNAQYFLGIHTGLILIMILYNLMVYGFIRDQSYLFYILSLFAYLLGSTTLDGATFEYLWGDYPKFNLIAVRIFLSIAWIFYLAFTQSFLNTKERMPMWHYAFYVVMGLQGAFFFANLLDYWNNYLFMVIVAIGVALTFIVAGISIYQRYRPAIYYMLANIGLVIVCIIIALWGAGILAVNPNDGYLLQWGITFQVLLFSAGLADRINLIRKKVDLQQRTHRETIERQNAELEARVHARTSELEDKNKELQEQKREMLVQNEELEQQNEEIVTQKDLIEAQKNAVAKAYKDIQVLKDLGRRINSSLEIKEIIQIAYDGISKLIESSGFGIGTLNRDKGCIDLIGYYRHGKHYPDYTVNIDEDERLIAWCVKRNQDVFVNDYQKEYEKYTKKPLKLEETDRELPNSLIYIPLNIKNQVVGILMVQSDQKDAFNTNHFDLLKSLAEYVAVGIDHSKAYGEVQKINDELQGKNTQIIDSLRYAQTIQGTILTDQEYLSKVFDDYFVIYKAKDLVSGDFYWMSKQGNDTFIAVVDCTGHGVPGAFMSMVGHELLNEIVTQRRIKEPGRVLVEMHKGVRKALQQDKGKNDDGMDMSICKLTYAEGERQVQVTFAGAKASIFYVDNNRIHELRGDKKSIGGMQREKERIFNDKTFALPKGSYLYLSTDGYMDQHNEIRKKFGKQLFKETLEIVSRYHLSKQRFMLEEALTKHQGKQDQRDDITVVGLKL